MASILGSDSRLQGGSFDMLSFDCVDLDEVLDMREPSLLCRFMKRDDLRWCETTVGLGA
jgi:hypothetical protein